MHFLKILVNLFLYLFFVITILYSLHNILQCIWSNTDSVENYIFFNSVKILYEKIILGIL